MLSLLTKRKKKRDEKPIIIFTQKKIKKIRGTIRGYSEFECSKIVIKQHEYDLKKFIALKYFNEIPLNTFIKKHKKTKRFLLDLIGKSNFKSPAKNVFSRYGKNKHLEDHKNKFIKFLTEDMIINEFYEQEKKKQLEEKKRSLI